MNQLKHYTQEIGVYIISGLNQEKQNGIMSLLGVDICIDMLEEHMAGTLIDSLMDIALESDGDVILTNTKSLELIDGYIATIEDLSKSWGMRIYICYNDDALKLNKLFENVRNKGGVYMIQIQMLCNEDGNKRKEKNGDV